MSTFDPDTTAKLGSLRDELVAAAEANRCPVCLGYLDEKAPGCPGPHVGPARRRRPAQAHTRRAQ